MSHEQTQTNTNLSYFLVKAVEYFFSFNLVRVCSCLLVAKTKKGDTLRDIIRMGLVLLIITLIASGLLAIIYSKTAPIIAENKRLEEERARKSVLPQADHFQDVKENDNIIYYKGLDKHNRLVGYTFKCEKYGYSSNVQTMVGIDTLFNIVAIKVVSQQETPGLGANCAVPEFAEKFKNKNPEKIKVDKDGGNIDSITGATITTRTITNSIKEKFLEIKEKLK